MKKSGSGELLKQLFSYPYRAISISLLSVLAATLINFYFGSSFQLQVFAGRLANRIEQQADLAKKRSEEATHQLAQAENPLTNTDIAEEWIKRSEQEGVHLLIYTNKKLAFWTTNHALPSKPHSLTPGKQFVHLSDGYYLIECTDSGTFRTLALVLLKSEYNYTNAYLQQRLNPRLSIPDYITMSDSLSGVAVSLKDQPSLFYIAFDNAKAKPLGVFLQNFCWILAFLSFFFFIDERCQELARKKSVGRALYLLLACIVLVRVVMLGLKFPFSFHQGWDLFNPSIYASNRLFPSLGDFVINGLLFLWVAYFWHRNVKKISVPGQFGKYGLFALAIGMILAIYVLSDLITFSFKTITVNSSIPFDLTNILSFTTYSYIAYIMLGINLYVFFLVCNSFLIWFDTFRFNREERFFVFIVGILFGFIYKVAFDTLDILMFTNAAYILALDRFRSKNIRYFSTKSLLIILILFSIVSSSKLQEFKERKDHETRKTLAVQLDSGSDAVTEYLLKDIMEKVRHDSLLVTALLLPKKVESDSLNERLKKLYFNNYFNKYAIRFNLYDAKRKAYEGTKTSYKELEQLLKLSGYEKGKTGLFKIEDQGGNQFYLCQLNIKHLDESIGSLFIDLESKTIENTNDFPDILVAGTSNANKDLATYSYAIYKNNRIISKYGSYTYSNADTNFKAARIGFNEIVKDGYSHLVYNPNLISRIVISTPTVGWYDRIAIFSYFFGFLSFFLFGIMLTRKTYQYIWKKLIRNGLSVIAKDLRNTGLSFKTRIQFSIIFTVVLSLMVVGAITFSYISNRYYDEQYTRLGQKVKSVQQAFESLHYYSSNNLRDKSRLAYDLSFISSLFNTDVSVYDTTGRLIQATQMRVFEQGLLSDQMNASAFTNVCLKQKTRYIAEESIGNLQFISANAPIRSETGETIGYVSLPFFANRDDYRAQVSYFVNALINVYALVFTIIGFLAFFVANAITAPFLVIEENLRKTKIGQINEPIHWKRKDEIGSLVTEYNRMISELEDSAEKLAQSERESAWREMAKQVAHEIKNPLTPLKLGLQHLERSWKNQDPDFDRKFERFSKTFIQQVETLSSIATEFSNFAKMPIGQEQEIDLVVDLKHVVNLFKQTENAQVSYICPADIHATIMMDPDQMIRTFNNLIKNAVQAIPDDRPGKVDVKVTLHANEVIVEISDNGTGIPPEIQQKIFTPNFTTKNSGMGLGLAIVKQMIENAKGSIYFETKADEGTSFFVRLPLYTA